MSAGRAIGEFASPLSATEILAYCEIIGIRGHHRLRVFEIVRQLDRVYIQLVNEKQAKA